MIDQSVFYDRRDNHCIPCEFWKGVCLKGHNLGSPAGCPIKKFPPVEGADYLQDRPAASTGSGEPRTGCCGGAPVIPHMSITGVMAQFTQAMAKWQKAGFPIASDTERARRVAICRSCPRYEWFHCQVCRCICLIKAGLDTEECPEKRW